MSKKPDEIWYVEFYGATQYEVTVDSEKEAKRIQEEFRLLREEPVFHGEHTMPAMATWTGRLGDILVIDVNQFSHCVIHSFSAGIDRIRLMLKFQEEAKKPANTPGFNIT